MQSNWVDFKAVKEAVPIAAVLQRYGVNGLHGTTNAGYAPPTGLEVLLPPAPAGAESVPLSAGSGQASDTALIEHARRDRPVVLRASGTAQFGDVVHAVDVCRGAGARVFLATPKE